MTREGSGRAPYQRAPTALLAPVGRTAIVYPGFLRAAASTVVNTTRYVWSRRRRLTLEGRVAGSEYRNWSGDRRHTAVLHQPSTVEELQEVVRTATSVRVVGSGHSFNDGLATDGATVSLDRLAGIVRIDRDTRRVTVRAGTRLRDLTPALLREGLAFATLASHDAQSIGGILSTDVHGTGRGPAHFSDCVVSLDLVDGTGARHDGLRPDDDRFRAAVGGIGAVGIITGATVQCVEAFTLQQGTRVETSEWAAANLEALDAAHEHVSFYAYPFTPLVHVHTWTRTERPRSFLGAFRESLNEAKAAVAAATLGDATAHWGLLPRTATPTMRLQKPSTLALHSHEAFSRSQYHLHQELEVAVPRERVWEDLAHLLDLYERRYAGQRLPFLLVEVRFTPAGHDASLLGAAVERDSAWLCLCANQSGAVGDYFADVEEWVRTSDARVHLGKWCEGLDAADVARMHGERFARFQEVRRRLDPDGRFTNGFVRRVLGDGARPRTPDGAPPEGVGAAGEQPP
ncbi:FAD-binding protein [Aquipuribacter nitratireducens]|uniref:FAD-binding protein n=1 Tax=Aquipuribacter nitratireducens TaxID=650104 RepID=A0ABW0GP11_9MICO